MRLEVSESADRKIWFEENLSPLTPDSRLLTLFFTIHYSLFTVLPMRFRLIWVGKTRNEAVSALAAEYLKRLRRFVACEIVEVRESSNSGERAVIADESRRIKERVADAQLTVLLDVDGRQWSSTELAAEIERWRMRGLKDVAFIIGGHLGVSDELKRSADVRWSLSRLTLTHEMARVILVEQLYRAHTILAGVPYQK
jgi:23S rRNA (pseudouridine1915-N3)-methyltransferase